jgi:hypothetical protein
MMQDFPRMSIITDPEPERCQKIWSEKGIKNVLNI